jgi:hypothetical protein
MKPDQTEFHAALLDPAQPVPGGLMDGQNRPAGRRFSVYRNNIAVSLTEALQSGFPVIAKLLGAENFDGIAGIFLRSHPPKSPLMMQYGDDFPAFLASFKPLGHLGYLADVARLELGLRASYHARDAEAVARAEIADMPPGDLMGATLSLAPALQICCSDWPIYDIWRYNTHHGAEKPRAVAQDVVITRAEFDPVPEVLPKGGSVWLRALSQGETFGAAHDKAVLEHPDFDLGATLAILINGNAITKLNPKDAT